jgi:hemolysin activation/secretion protein
VHLTNEYNVGAAAAAVAGSRSDGNTRVDEAGYRHDFARTRLGSASVGVAFNVKSATFDSPPSVIYDDKLTTARIDAQWERVDTRFHGVDTLLFSYTHGFNNILGALGAYDPAEAANSHTSRLGASGEFNKVNLEIQRLQRITRYTSLVLRINGQYTPDPLVSLEQFSMGGPDSVRAYPVSQALAEKGGVATLEYVIGAPGFAGRQGPGNRAWGDILQFSLFADYANGELNAPLTTNQNHDIALSGAGGALQFSLPGRLFARVDVATPFNNRTPVGGHHPQCYFRLGTSF